MDQHTRDEAVIQIVDAMWHMVEHLRNMDRSWNLIERRGIQIRIDIPNEDEIAKRLKKKIWPAVDKLKIRPKSPGLTWLRKTDKIVSEA